MRNLTRLLHLLSVALNGKARDFRVVLTLHASALHRIFTFAQIRVGRRDREVGENFGGGH